MGLLELKQKLIKINNQNLKVGLKILASACAVVLRANRTADDNQSSNNDDLGTREQGAASFEENSSMLRRSVSNRRL